MTIVLALLITVSPVGLFLLSLIFRPEFTKLTLTTRQIMIEIAFTLAMISFFLIQTSIGFSIAVKNALAAAVLLVLTVVSCFVAKVEFFVSFTRMKIWQLLILIILCLIFIFLTTVHELLSIVVGAMVTPALVCIIILHLMLRFGSDDERILKEEYPPRAVVLGTIASFLIWMGIVKTVTHTDISSMLRAINDCDKIEVVNSFPQIYKGAPPWGREKIVITDKTVIQKCSDILSHSKYEMLFQPGLAATKNAVYFHIYKNQVQIGYFYFISGTLQLGTEFHRYESSDSEIVKSLRETVGAKKYTLE